MIKMKGLGTGREVWRCGGGGGEGGNGKGRLGGNEEGKECNWEGKTGRGQKGRGRWGGGNEEGGERGGQAHRMPGWKEITVFSDFVYPCNAGYPS